MRKVVVVLVSVLVVAMVLGCGATGGSDAQPTVVSSTSVPPTETPVPPDEVEDLYLIKIMKVSLSEGTIILVDEISGSEDQTWTGEELEDGESLSICIMPEWGVVLEVTDEESTHEVSVGDLAIGDCWYYIWGDSFTVTVVKSPE